MPYALETFTTDEFANPTSAVTISPAGSYIEFSGYAKTGNDDEYRILGSSSSFVQIVALTPTEILVRPVNSSDDMEFNTGYTQPAVDEDFTVRIERLSLLEWECFLNGVSLGTKTINNRDLSITQFFNLNTSGQAFIGGCYYIEACTDGTGTATNRWENTTGTGSTWEDSIGSNDAPLSATFPNDNSQWVFFSDGAPSEPSISAADNIDSEDDTVEFTLADNSAAPVSATLNGTDVGTLTLVSGSTYSYTAPLIADDDTADLVVTVDSTTASTVISYANSYPYELVTHGEPDANSIFFNTAFATNDPVEWGVTTDFDSGVVTVDYSAMDAAEDELNDVALHSTEVAAGESTATFKYFVPESGASGTFQATITVAEDVDTTPAAFAFTDQTGVEPESVDESNAITITGVDAGEDIAVTITGGQYAVSTDGGSSFGGWTSAGTNVQLNHQIKVRNTASSEFSTAANTTLTAGGVSDTFTRTTRAAVLPTLDTPIPDLDLGETDAVNLDLDDHFSGASSYTLTGIPTDSGLSFSGSVLSGNVNKDDIAASPFNLTATAFSADGSIQDVFEVVVVDDIVPVISINSLTTTDTTPVVTGSAGDATSLTLVVNSVTYNPTPSGGTWSQQLPELALDTYPMTLNGQDAAGNDAVEAQAVLTVVDEIVATGNGLFRPLFRASKKSTFKNLFR